MAAAKEKIEAGGRPMPSPTIEWEQVTGVQGQAKRTDRIRRKETIEVERVKEFTVEQLEAERNRLDDEISKLQQARTDLNQLIGQARGAFTIND